jgi:hypothetical protein
MRVLDATSGPTILNLFQDGRDGLAGCRLRIRTFVGR